MKHRSYPSSLLRLNMNTSRNKKTPLDSESKRKRTPQAKAHTWLLKRRQFQMCA